MKVTLLAYGIAKEIIGGRSLVVELKEGATIGTLKQELVARYPEFNTLNSLSFAAAEEYRDDHYALSDQCEVAIIPPVSGG